MSDKKGIGQRILDIDRRIIASIALICIIGPILYPLGLPIVIPDVTRDTFELVESLNEGDVVLFENSFDTGYYGSIGPGVTAMFTHLIEKNVKLVVVSLHIEGPITFFLAWDGVPKALRDGYVYGEDWVYLGFMTGGEAAQLGIAEDLQGVYSSDYYGSALNDLAILDNINSHEDYDLIIGAWRGGEYGGHTYRTWGETYQKPLIQMGQMADWPQNLLDAGILAGYVRGTRGAAEYELLTGYPGLGIAAMDAVSLAFIWLIIVVIVGNIGFYLREMEAKK